jgi:DNA-directed RNA polymerase subunit omega
MFKLPEGMESKYRFVTVAALRAEQLQMGATPRVQSASRKTTVVAQQEVAAGLVTPWDPDAPELTPEAAEAAAEAEEDEDEE